MVIGVRKKNPDEGLIRRIGSKVFSYIMQKISDVPPSLERPILDFRPHRS